LRETTPDSATPLLSRSFHTPKRQLYLSTDSSLTHSGILHGDLLSFRLRHYFPIRNSTLFSSSLVFPKENKHGRSLMQSIHCVTSESANLRPPSSLSTAPNCPFCVQPPEHVDDPAPAFNGYVYNVVLYPSGQFELLSGYRCKLRRRIFNSTREMRRVHRESEGCEWQY